MIKNIKELMKLASMLLLGSLFLSQCEPDADSLGEQFFIGDAAEANEIFYRIIANNVNNNDSIRSDASRLSVAEIGAFTEGVFGMQKAAFVSQVRMSSYNPTFGDNAVVDSVVLVLNPANLNGGSGLITDSITTTTDESYVYPDGDVAAKKEVKTYPISRYGKANLSGTDPALTLQVHEVTDFLESNSTAYYSNHLVNTAGLLGQKDFNGKVSSTVITSDADASTLWSNDANIRIPLDATFFQNKIIAKEGSTELNDAANFIRHFRGIKVSVVENDGFLFQVNPATTSIIMYYKYDEDDNGTITRPQKSFTFSFADPNVRIGQYQYNRTGSTVATALASSNLEFGDPQLFPQGMGGPSVKVKIPVDVISNLKTKFAADKIGIISAKLRFYVDQSTWDNNYTNPSLFSITNLAKTSFLENATLSHGSHGYYLLNEYNLTNEPAYYDFAITKDLKDVIELEEAPQDFLIEMGSFLINPNSTNQSPYGISYTTRPFNPYRVVLVGSDADNPYAAQLKIIYGTK